MTENLDSTASKFVILSILFYFLIHAMTTLVSSIYLLDLLNTQIDTKVLGLLFFFSTALLYLINLSHRRLIVLLLIMSISRSIYPFVSTPFRLLLAGIVLGSLLMIYPIVLRKMRRQEHFVSLIGISSLLGTLLAIFFRSIHSSWDITDSGYFRFLPLLLTLIIMVLVIRDDFLVDELSTDSATTAGFGSLFINILGIFAMILLLYLAYSSPAVIARWTGVNYLLVLGLILFGYVLPFIFLSFGMQQLTLRKAPLILWNLIFFSSLVLMIIFNQVKFVNSPAASPIIVHTTPLYLHIPLIINLLSSGVIFLNLMYFAGNLSTIEFSSSQLTTAFLLSELVSVILIFIFIFTSVWGYVEPVSPIFRGLFWLPFLIIALVTVLTFVLSNSRSYQITPLPRLLGIILLVLLIGSLMGSSFNSRTSPLTDDDPSTIRVMTYNIQQGADVNGEINIAKQLHVIRDINPDIIGIEESDTAKINTANIDTIRYFRDNLHYYSYYGPKTVMQTFGVAILSRYPIREMTTFYTSGNVDEIGSIRVTIDIDGVAHHVFVNHPAGSDSSKLDHTQTLLELANGLDHVMMLGDFNWREHTIFYDMITQTYNDTWRAVYPNGIDSNGLIMNSTIDHIFVSPTYQIINTIYIPSPQSESDHPVLYTELKL